MLKELIISNFAIIDRLELSLEPGLSCLTGETGAGKSILIDAISAVLGGRTDSDNLRPGKDTQVEAAFDITGMPELKARLAELGLDDGDELILRRAFTASGRGRVYINGSLANMATLQETGDLLVDIHGQHEHQSLFKAGTHLDMLDAYCALGARRADCRAAYDRLAALRKRHAELSAQSRERARRLDLLSYQRDEIDAASPVSGEEEGLGSERARLMHADRLRELVMSALDALRDGDVSAHSLAGGALKSVREVASITPGESESVALLESADASITEACARLREFAEGLESDPERLSEIETRLDALCRLKKKYGETLDEVLAFRESVDVELSSIEGGDEEMESLAGMIAGAGSELSGIADELGREREAGAAGFCRKVEAELSGMGMDKAVFEVRLDRLTEPGPLGRERAEFMFSANPGEQPRPLAKVASGGELSRVMLALKVVLAGADRVPTLIFDEVDSGVGGVTASAVGQKLKEAASGRQVLCITHLPQVASFAGTHFKVEKSFADGRVAVGVVRLSGDERVREVARMLGGTEGSDTASAHAEELVKRGRL
ncbi:MAG: DNA repair protein RecN [Nitrospirae bacterium]|nr:DNA repair protein RecN [Nitrospirota bacterium]MBI5694374.1 DNA repair protein RecN [Nitrospirota bacterium]